MNNTGAAPWFAEIARSFNADVAYEHVAALAQMPGRGVGQPGGEEAASYIEDVSIIFKMHLFLGLTIFLLFAFTRLVHMLSPPLRFVLRPGYQIVRSRRQGSTK